ncbi:hypothetical protein OCK02_24890 [Rhizobium sp. TRM96647]|uniref:hypothetical protein n=1 Tax=unclassified Rhizobium TaxID=2613769 RepID=UPI0021E9336F|nr:MULTISPECIES: hypothetical protein [unclassified Rhizobium]MCV3739396.1 hypothetical protein [Rhizobium sp. TRM96647]MCV3761062.1 hypothetical protein [Rhizobium sp. TRM96650]
MAASGIIGRFRRKELSYILGRFRTVRAVYGTTRHFLERIRSPLVRRSKVNESSLFSSSVVSTVVKSIRDEAVFVGLNLPEDVVAEIKAFALSEPLHAIYDPNGPTFKYADVVNGISTDGRKMPIGGIKNPARCPAVQRIIDDPVLRDIVRRYLRHDPLRVTTILDWSFGSDLSDEERRNLKHHVIDYHYDVSGYDFLYASFYITDTDRYSGAHVMMKRSHKRKPLRMLFGSARASQEAVYKQFGRQNEIVIEGGAGTGFVQDTSCYHRASPPTRGDRLMLAVRFIN